MTFPSGLFAYRTIAAVSSVFGSFLLAPPCPAIDERTTAAIVELLVSDRADDRARGERLVSLYRLTLSENLVKRSRSPDPAVAGTAAAELGIIISPWLRGKETSARSRTSANFVTACRPVDRVPTLSESATIRESLQTTLSALLDRPRTDSRIINLLTDSIAATYETLGEVADDSTMDWAITKLAHLKTPELAEPLLLLANSYLGVPPIYQPPQLIDAYSRAEWEQFFKEKEQAVAEASTKVSALWQEVKPMNAEERIRFAIKSWREHFVPLLRVHSGHYRTARWVFLEMEPLIRFGAPCVNLLRAQQALETELEVKAVWEVVIATITGHEDAALVRALFNGSDTHQELACEVVAGAASKRWPRELEELQRKGGYLAEKASSAIAACYREDGFSSLEKGLRRYRFR